jgi:hypothetical protein
LEDGRSGGGVLRMLKDYHCCATCQHFLIQRVNQTKVVQCKRLGFDTKPSYKFHCWTPRPDIQKKMDEQAQSEA